MTPSQSVPHVVSAAGPGASLCFKKGVYRLGATVKPLAGQTLTFEPGAVLNGSTLLTNWVREGAYWVATGQSQSFSESSWLGDHRCTDANAGACVYEDLFFDDQPLQHVTSIAELGPGKVYFDKTADRMYIAQDPSGHKLEATTLTIAMEAVVDGVTIRGATIEKIGWIGLKAIGNNWVIDRNEIRYAHATGVRLQGSGHLIRGNHIHHNGNTGLVASNGTNVIFEENHLAYNNYLDFGVKPIPHHEGAVKVLKTSDVTVRNNYSHHNNGDGWWFDADNIRILIENNVFSENTRYGLFYEISFDALIRNNVFRGNGTDRRWLGSGIRISTSKNVEITHNLFEDNEYSTLVANWSDRGAGAYGTFETTNLYVHHNDFILREGFVGATNGKGDIGYPTSNNHFEANNYFVTDLARKWWSWRPDGAVQWEAWRSLNFDVAGTLTKI